MRPKPSVSGNPQSVSLVLTADKAAGVYYPESGGPVDADAAPAQLAARFDGTVSGTNLHLNFKQAKGGVDQAFDMVAGKRQKLIRCL